MSCVFINNIINVDCAACVQDASLAATFSARAPTPSALNPLQAFVAVVTNSHTAMSTGAKAKAAASVGGVAPPCAYNHLRLSDENLAKAALRSVHMSDAELADTAVKSAAPSKKEYWEGQKSARYHAQWKNNENIAISSSSGRWKQTNVSPFDASPRDIEAPDPHAHAIEVPDPNSDEEMHSAHSEEELPELEPMEVDFADNAIINFEELSASGSIVPLPAPVRKERTWSEQPRYPIQAISKRQNADSTSTLEAEIVAITPAETGDEVAGDASDAVAPDPVVGSKSSTPVLSDASAAGIDADPLDASIVAHVELWMFPNTMLPESESAPKAYHPSTGVVAMDVTRSDDAMDLYLNKSIIADLLDKLMITEVDESAPSSCFTNEFLMVSAASIKDPPLTRSGVWIDQATYDDQPLPKSTDLLEVYNIDPDLLKDFHRAYSVPDRCNLHNPIFMLMTTPLQLMTLLKYEASRAIYDEGLGRKWNNFAAEADSRFDWNITLILHLSDILTRQQWILHESIKAEQDNGVITAHLSRLKTTEDAQENIIVYQLSIMPVPEGAEPRGLGQVCLHGRLSCSWKSRNSVQLQTHWLILRHIFPC